MPLGASSPPFRSRRIGTEPSLAKCERRERLAPWSNPHDLQCPSYLCCRSRRRPKPCWATPSGEMPVPANYVDQNVEVGHATAEEMGHRQITRPWDSPVLASNLPSGLTASGSESHLTPSRSDLGHIWRPGVPCSAGFSLPELSYDVRSELNNIPVHDLRLQKCVMAGEEQCENFAACRSVLGGIALLESGCKRCPEVQNWRNRS